MASSSLEVEEIKPLTSSTTTSASTIINSTTATATTAPGAAKEGPVNVHELPRIELQTARLTLRGVLPSDAGPAFEILSNEDVMRYWSTPPLSSPEESAAWISKMATLPSDGRTDFVVVERRENRVIGKAGLWRLEPAAELGIILHPAYWGRGYAEEAIRAVLENAWSLDWGGRVGVDCVTADTDPRNTACLRLLQKLGFVRTGEAKNTFETHLGWCDSVYLQLENPTRGAKGKKS